MIIPKVSFFGQLVDKNHFKTDQFSIVSSYETDEDFVRVMVEDSPDVIISLGETWATFPKLIGSPHFLKRKWIHFNNLEEVRESSIIHCYLNSIMTKDENFPLVTVFSTTYKSGQRIMKPLTSLLKQTYKDWEWVIMDDSDDNGETYNMLKELSQVDYRIRLYKADKHSGYIGKVKRDVAMLGHGEILVELDHDDDIMESCLAEVVKAFKSDPEVGMVYTDCVEMFENGDNFHYGENWAFGYGTYVKWLHEGRWINAAQTPPINDKTIRYIVGVPNHIRAWRASVYREMGGHNYGLHVVDDYELIIRTFLKYKLMRIPKCLYIQYRNQGGNNFTFIRNAEIQKLTKLVSSHYNRDIHERLVELGIPDYTFNEGWKGYGKDWEKDPVSECGIKRYANLVMEEDSDTISIVMPTYNRSELLERAVKSVLNQTHQKWILYIVGDNCPVMEEVMEKLKDERIRWWNLAENHGAGGAIPRNYALKMLVNTKYVAYLDDDNMWRENHLETLLETMESEPDIQFAFSSFKVDNREIVCREPKKFRIDTSCILHRRSLLDKYGYWKDRVTGGYAHDWEFVSRWLNEKWKPTLAVTLDYNTDTNQQNGDALYFAYDDQN